MILEVAVLTITPAQKAQFEAAFIEARQIISTMPGFVSHQLHRCIETDGRYLLLVQWLTVEHHMAGC
ncbi:MAG: antibiotic biosynthesis monooxygenase family protein [Steroidobacteraceae bacterium]